MYKNDLFTKTGSGQNIGKALKKETTVFLQRRNIAVWRYEAAAGQGQVI
jgi:hypothetical protein